MPSDRRGGLTPLTLLLVLVVGYLLIQIQFVLVLVLLSLVFRDCDPDPGRRAQSAACPAASVRSCSSMWQSSVRLTVLFMLLSPAIREQATAFRQQAPQSLADLRATWLQSGNALLAGPGQQLLGRGIAFIQSPDQTQGITVPQGAALGLLTGLGGGIIGLVTVLIISFYYLMEKSVDPAPRAARLRSGDATSVSAVSGTKSNRRSETGYVGSLTLCLIIGVTATIG